MIVNQQVHVVRSLRQEQNQHCHHSIEPLVKENEHETKINLVNTTPPGVVHIVEKNIKITDTHIRRQTLPIVNLPLLKIAPHSGLVVRVHSGEDLLGVYPSRSDKLLG